MFVFYVFCIDPHTSNCNSNDNNLKCYRCLLDVYAKLKKETQELKLRSIELKRGKAAAKARYEKLYGIYPAPA